MNARMIMVLAVLVAVLGLMSGMTRADLIAHWAFDEAYGASTAVDSTGSHDGVIDTTSAIKPTTGETFAKIGKSYLFTGTANPAGNGGVTVASAPDLDTYTNATFSGWLYYRQNLDLYKPMMVKYDSTQTTFFHAVYMNDYTMLVKFKTPDTLQTGYNASDHLSEGAWYHVAIIYTGPAYDGSTTGTATTTLYVNGKYISSASKTNQKGIMPDDAPLLLGTQPGTGYSAASFDGWLDDLGIWNEALTVGKIGALCNTPNVGGLGAYNLSYMKKLFDVYDAGSGSDVIGGLTWEYATSLTGGEGAAWAAGGYYHVQLDAAGNGVKAQIPEPSTLLLLTSGLLGLLAYAWKRRK